MHRQCLLRRLGRHFPKPQAELINQIIIGEHDRQAIICWKRCIVRREGYQLRQLIMDFMRAMTIDVQQQQKAA